MVSKRNDEKVGDYNSFKVPKEDGDTGSNDTDSNYDDFISMDYTPVRKKPPIHN